MAFQLRNLGPWLRIPDKSNAYKRNWLALEATINQDTPLCYGATGTIPTLTNSGTQYVVWTASSLTLADPFKMLGYGASQHQPTWIRIPWDGIYDFYIDWQITDSLSANAPMGFPMEQAATNDSGFVASPTFSQFAYDSKTFITTTIDNHFHAFYRGIQFNKDDLVRAGIKTSYSSAGLTGITVVNADFRWTQPIPNRQGFQTGGPLTLFDASPNSNNGLYVDNNAPSILFNQTGLVTGDTSVNFGDILAGPTTNDIAVTLPSGIGGAFWAMGWSIAPFVDNGEQPLLTFASTNGTEYMNVLWANKVGENLFTFNRVTNSLSQNYNSGPLGSTIPFTAHTWAVVYDPVGLTLKFYLDGSQYGSTITVAANAFTVTPTLLSINGYPLTINGAVGTYDELAFGTGTITSGQISTIYGDRGSFATYSAAVLALSPTAYYHLNESY